MLQRIWAVAIKAVAIAVVLLGVPLSLMVPFAVWNSRLAYLQQHANVLVELVDHADLMRHLRGFNIGTAVRARIQRTSGAIETVGANVGAPAFHVQAKSQSGGQVDLWVSAWPAILQIVLLVLLVVLACTFAAAIAWMMARRAASRLVQPLQQLALQAEQVGAGHVSLKLRPVGIKEIDLVQEELVRTSERMTARIAAERQFSANASHQLRTPLTALSMRLEEIQMESDQEHVRDEAARCLEQIERLTGVIEDLMEASQARNRGAVRAIELAEIFRQQEDEWRIPFERAGRGLTFVGGENFVVLATPGSLSQIIATLLENSLKYGLGETRVSAAQGSSSRIVTVDVSDRGPGVSEELATNLFEKGISGHGSTGLGLALARELANTDGARLELMQRRPPRFRITLAAVPAAFKPAKELPDAVMGLAPPRRRFR